MKFLTGQWLKAAQDDLLTIEKIMTDHNLTQIAAFHAQQAIEKSFKALFEEKGIKVLKTHDIVRLQKQIESLISFTSDEKDKLISINELYIDSRYPGELGLLPDGTPSIEDAQDYYNFVVSVFERVKKILEK